MTQHPRGMGAHSHRDLNTNIPSGFIGNGSKPEGSRTPSRERMAQLWHRSPYRVSTEEGGCPGNDAEWEKPTSEDRVLSGSVYAALWKWQNYRQGRSVIARHCGKREEKPWL